MTARTLVRLRLASAALLAGALVGGTVEAQTPAQPPPAQPPPVQQQPGQPQQPQPVQPQPVQQQPVQPPVQSQPQAVQGEPVQPQLVQATPLHGTAHTRRRTFPMRPYRGLFGGTAIGPSSPGLSATFAGYGGHDDDLLGTQSGSSSRGSGIGGNLFGGSVGLAYDRPGQRLAVSGNFASDVRHYPSLEHTTWDYSGLFAVDFAVGRRTRVAAVQSAEYGSLFRFSSLPGQGLPAGGEIDADYGVSDRLRLASASSVSVRYTLSTRSALVADANYLRTDADGTSFDRRTWGVSGGFERDVSRRLSLHMGYRYQEGLFGDPAVGRRTILNSLDVGVGYVWPLSFLRRTTVRFSGGGGRIARETLGATSINVLRATGSATVTHLMGRTWTLDGTYDRGLQFVELFPDPFFVDSFRATLNGMMTRRLEFRATSSYSNGQLTLTGTGPGRTSYGATSRLGYAFNPALEVALDYSYYYYDFGGTADVPIGLAPRLDRQSVRVSVRYWLPLFVTR